MRFLILAAVLSMLSRPGMTQDLQRMGAEDIRNSAGETAVPPAFKAEAVRTPYACGGYPLAMRLRSRTVTLPAAGVWTLESHLATRSDFFPSGFPRSTRENISSHIANSCAALKKLVPFANCGEVYGISWNKEWTPPEHGRAGQGSIGGAKPSREEEM